MRYNVDLVNNENKKPIIDNINIKDRMNDSYLVVRINDYKKIPYDTLINKLYQNPLLYNYKKDDIKIEYLDDFCFKYQDKPLSIGGLVLSKEFKRREKKKLIKKYFNKNIEEYNKDLNDRIKQMDSIANLADAFGPKKIKFLTFTCFLLMTLFIYLINFPPTAILNLEYIGEYIKLINEKCLSNNLLNIFRYISFLTLALTTLYILFYTICCFFLTRKYDRTFDRIEELSNKIGLKTKKAFKKIIKHYNKQIKIKSISKFKQFKVTDIINKKYQISNIDTLNKNSVNRLSNIKSTISRIYKSRIIVYLLAILVLICYILLLIFK